MRLEVGLVPAALGLSILVAGREMVAADRLTAWEISELVRAELHVERFSVAALELPSLEGAADLPRSLVVAVERHGRARRLRLERCSVRAPRFQLLRQAAGGELLAIDPPPPSTYRGTIEGAQGSRVAASLLGSGLYALVFEADGDSWAVRPLRQLDPRAGRESHVVFAPADEAPFRCGTEGTVVPAEDVSGARAPDGGGAGAGSCLLTVAEVAFDSDYEFFADDCDGNPDTCMAIVETGLNITNLIYVRDVKITHELTALVIRSDPQTDIYAQFPNASDFGAMLTAFRSEWNANMGSIDYDAAYLLTGKSRPEFGGLAFVGVVCTSSRYGMGIGGWGYEGIYRHELGHNWGTGHSCGAERRYIMCGNSIDAISAFNIKVMAAHRDSRNCLENRVYDGGEPAPPYVRLDRATLLQGDGPISIDVAGGDTDPNCGALRLTEHDARSAFGASIRLADSVDPAAPPSLLYTPRSDFVGTDYFRYGIVDGSGFEATGGVLVEVAPRAMIVYLKLDETSGTDASDSSGHANDGELRGELTFAADTVPGRHGRALRFEGIEEEYVSLGDSSAFDLRRRLTVAAWFRVEAFAGSGEAIVAKGSDAWRLKRDGTSRHLRFTASGLSVRGSDEGDLPGTIPVDDGAWHHAAGVYDGNRMYLYVDGELDASAAATGLINTNSSSVHIGDNGWNGAIDEVRMYNHALTADEIRTLYLDARNENPSPSDGAAGFVPGSSLAWIGAASVSAHDLYIGTDRAAVAAATPASPEHAGRLPGSVFKPAIDPGTTYFWRVDEVAGAEVRRGTVRTFASSFAFTSFDDPPLGAASFVPGPGDTEIGFRTTSSPTGGDSPFAGVIGTSSTPATPVFSHRSVAATTTFNAVDLSERGSVAASLILQARDTGYEEGEDFIEVYAANGGERVHLLRLDGGNPLTQYSGSGYFTLAANLPATWDEARLVVASSSNSSAASERYDFDSVGFFCQKLFRVIAFSYFDEPALGAASYAPGPGGAELGFTTEWAASGGLDPFAGVAESGDPSSRVLVHRSAGATTTFETVDLRGRGSVRATVVLRIRETGYEADDFLRVFVTGGAGGPVDLLDANGDTGLDGLDDDEYSSFWAEIPDGWDAATLVIASSSDSSAASERYDIRAVEFTSRAAGDPCAGDVPPGTPFRRGDANADGNLDVSDGVRILNYLFLGGVVVTCLDAADSNDSGGLDLTDSIRIFNYLFLGAEPLPFPGDLACGVDPTDDVLACGEFGACP